MKKLLSLLSLITIAALSTPQADAIRISNVSNHQVIMDIPGTGIVDIQAGGDIILVDNPETLSSGSVIEIIFTINNHRYQVFHGHYEAFIRRNNLRILEITISMQIENLPIINVQFTNNTPLMRLLRNVPVINVPAQQLMLDSGI